MLIEREILASDEFGYASAATGVPRERVTSLIAGLSRSLEADPDLARHYLAELSALLDDRQPDTPAHEALLPQRIALPAGIAKGGLARWQVTKVERYVEGNLERPLVTEDLAAVARLSTGHFCRAFKASLGETPHSYVVRQRLRRAQSLMLATRDSLSQIACACGLTDQAHLSRLFRRVIGTTPMAWRRDWQQC